MNADLCFGFTKSKWKELKPRLDDNDETAWTEGIGVFERRMKERFLSSIDALFAADTRPDLTPSNSVHTGHCIPGFAIMALCCLLIETLQGFRGGSSSDTRHQFIKFLRRPAFGSTFNDDVAKKFTDGIRNGILHEAETRKWVIWREEPAGKIAEPEEDGYALNRSLFYAAVKKEFESYLRELRESSEPALRQRFKKKMDNLCREA